MLAIEGLTRAVKRLKLLKYFSSSLSLVALSLMPLTPQDIAQYAGETAKDILGAAPGVAAAAAAAYVKGPLPPSIIPNVGQAVARQACRRYGSNPGAVSGRAAAGLEAVCRPYLDDIAEGSGPGIAEPFEGGQCVGAKYFVTYQFNTVGTGGQTIEPPTVINGAGAPVGYTGPIGGIRAVGPDGAREIILDTGAGEVSLRFSSAPQGDFRNVKINSIAPREDNPNNCGNPPPVVRPPTPGPTGQPVRQPYNPSPDIDINIDVDIGPTGGITFNIGTGPITIDPFGGGGDGGGGGDPPGTAPSSGLPPGDIGAPGAASEPGPGGTAAGCAPAGSVLVGVKVVILAAPPFGSEYDPLVRRGVCYVYMGVPGNLALNPEGVALRSGQILFAPLDNLTCYEVRANTGYTLRVTPYYRALESQTV